MCLYSAPTLFKNIESWDDTKQSYREGFPVKDSKAPKRRAQLMEAIAEADKEFLLPVEERVDGLLKVQIAVTVLLVVLVVCKRHSASFLSLLCSLL